MANVEESDTDLHRDLEVEMSEREAEVQVLITENPRQMKTEVKARGAAYRSEMQCKRTVLLLLMIVPVLFIIIGWHVFDTNSKLGVSSPVPPTEYTTANITGTLP